MSIAVISDEMRETERDLRLATPFNDCVEMWMNTLIPSFGVVVNPSSLSPSDTQQSKVLQGDTSGCAEPPVDIKTKVVLMSICFEVNGKFATI